MNTKPLLGQIAILLISVNITFGVLSAETKLPENIPLCTNIEETELPWNTSLLRKAIGIVLNFNEQQIKGMESHRYYNMYDCGAYFILDWQLPKNSGVFGTEFVFLFRKKFCLDGPCNLPDFQSISVLAY